MERNTFIAIILSTLFLILWWTFYPQPKPIAAPPGIENQVQLPQNSQARSNKTQALQAAAPLEISKEVIEKEIVIKTESYYAVFTTKGAAIKHWLIKEKTGKDVDLALAPESLLLSTFEDINFDVIEQNDKKLVFSAVLGGNKKIVKTFDLTDKYLHTLSIETNTPFSLTLASGLGTDDQDKDENLKLTRAIGLPVDKTKKIEAFKPGEYSLASYQWTAVDNRYFLSALIPQNIKDFDTIIVKKEKKTPPVLMLSKTSVPVDAVVLKFYLGPKEIKSLKEIDLNFESTIDFGWFGFLSKLALEVLNFFHRLTNNFGWSIILLTIVIQIIVFPLTIKSFKAQAAMKRLNPFIKEIQAKYKNDPKRLNMEMLNVYKTQKVNPLGGCLPMLLQIPIFWALFNALRNTYELRGAPWILWVKDLSLHDPYYILPIVMGIGMLLQQKMVSVTADPTQAKLMYLMPVIFTFMFLNFPAGLVLYWLTNSVISMIEQYFIMMRQEEVA